MFPLILFKISHSILSNETEHKCYEYSYPFPVYKKIIRLDVGCLMLWKISLSVKKNKGVQGLQFIEVACELGKVVDEEGE